MKKELHNVVDLFSSNELLFNFTTTDDLHCGPPSHDMTELHEITPNSILNEPWDTPEDPVLAN